MKKLFALVKRILRLSSKAVVAVDQGTKIIEQNPEAFAAAQQAVADAQAAYAGQKGAGAKKGAMAMAALSAACKTVMPHVLMFLLGLAVDMLKNEVLNAQTEGAASTGQ